MISRVASGTLKTGLVVKNRRTPTNLSEIIKIASRHFSTRAVPKPAATMGSNDEYSSRWEKMWKGDSEGSLKPGVAFDAAGSSPALIDCLASGKLGNLDSKRILVPGCGRGYDLVSFIQAGAAEVVGLELAPTAVDAATSYIGEQLGDAANKAPIVLGDFFNWDSGEGFHVGFDYTFFCAMHPSMRADWANAWARHLKPGGLLVALMFPVEGMEDRDRQGPPWPVWPELYKEYLVPSLGFELRSMEQVPKEQSHSGREGREWLAVWEKKALL